MDSPIGTAGQVDEAARVATRSIAGRTRSEGASQIRNAGGTGWGSRGDAWLRCDYVRNGFAGDFWTCFALEWIDTGQFKQAGSGSRCYAGGVAAQ